MEVVDLVPKDKQEFVIKLLEMVKDDKTREELITMILKNFFLIRHEFDADKGQIHVV